MLRSTKLNVLYNKGYFYTENTFIQLHYLAHKESNETVTESNCKSCDARYSD